MTQCTILLVHKKENPHLFIGIVKKELSIFALGVVGRLAFACHYCFNNGTLVSKII